MKIKDINFQVVEAEGNMWLLIESPDGRSNKILFNDLEASLTNSGRFMGLYVNGPKKVNTYWLTSAGIWRSKANFTSNIEPTANNAFWNLEFQSASKHTQDIPVFLKPGHTFGKYKNLDIIPAIGKTDKQIITEAVSDVQPPVYNLPSANLNTTPSPNGLEVGDIINISCDSNFVQNDAGSINLFEMLENGVAFANNEPVTRLNVEITEVAKIYQARYYYLEGPIKNNDAGVPDSRGRIGESSILTPSRSYVGSRIAKFGFNQGHDSASARALSGTLVAPAAGSNFNIAIPQGAERVEIIFPATIRDLFRVLYVEDSNKNITGNFIKLPDILMAGANGYNPILNKRYAFVPVEPFPSAVNYNVTL